MLSVLNYRPENSLS